MRSAETVLEAIKRRATQLNSLLKSIDDVFNSGIMSLRSIISTEGMNWNDYSREQKEAIHKVFLTA